MAESGVIEWIRDPKSVFVEIATPKSQSSNAKPDEEIIIEEEGFTKEQDEIIINDQVFHVSGTMRVEKDGSIVAAPSQPDRNDLSEKFTCYEMPSTDRSRIQPRCVLLESQYLERRFIHWDLSGPKVMCELLQFTTTGGPLINIKEMASQQFMWIIPLEESTQFALQTYGQSYYLKFGADGKALLQKGGDSSSDLHKNSAYRLSYIQEEAKTLIKLYYDQITKGCGQKDCENDQCASSKRFKYDQISIDEAAAKAIHLFKRQSKLCVPNEEHNHKVTNPPVEKQSDIENDVEYSIPVQETGDIGRASQVGVLYTKTGAKLAVNAPKQEVTEPFLTEEEVVRLLSKGDDNKTPDYAELSTLIYSVFSSPEALNNSFLLPPAEGQSGSINVDVASVRRTYKYIYDLEVERIQNTFLHAIQNYCNNLEQLCKQGTSPLLKSLNHCVIVLENPLLHSPEYVEQAFPKFLQALGHLPINSELELVKWYASYPPEELLEFVQNLHQVITVTIVLSENGSRKKSVHSFPAILAATKALKIFYLANLLASKNAGQCRPRGKYHSQGEFTSKFMSLQEQLGIHPNDIIKPIIPFDEFINEELNNVINIFSDYDSLSLSQFSFFHYPYLLTPANKIEKLFLDNKMAMLQQRRMILLNALINGQQALELPVLLLAIDRHNIVNDTLTRLEVICENRPEDLRKQLRVKFDGEEGIDEGGVQKEFFQLLIEELFNPEIGMFIYDEEQHHYWFNPNSFESEGQFMLIGLLLGLAIYNNVILDVHFPMVVYRKLVGCALVFQDLYSSHPQIAQSLQLLLEYKGDDVEEAFGLTFQVTFSDVFGDLQACNLKENGEAIPVTNDNLQEYVDLYVDWLLSKSIEVQFKAFKKGFDLVIRDTSLVELFRPEEVELLVCGSKDFDFDALESTTSYDGGFTREHPVIKNFWDIVHSFSDQQKRQLLQFVTGSDKVPVGGLSKLKLLIVKNGPDSDRLPTAHTCFNALLLCEYSSKAKLQERLLKAITHAKGFGML